MYFSIDYHSGVSVSAQLLEQIKYRVVSGELKAGDKLPSVRGLADQLHVNPTTVARVYRQLELEGVIATQAGSGTYVSGRTPGLTLSEQKRRLARPIRDLVVEAGSLGVDYERLLTWINEEVDRIRKGKG